MRAFARKKVGFTKVGTDQDGEPVYIGGMQGVLERNTLRNYLAVTAFLDTIGESDECRFEKWFEETEKYYQLKELSRSDYLKYKRMEQENQVSAQRELARPQQ